MPIDAGYLRQLIDRQTESLSVEIKRWINPSLPEGMGKIVKSCIALRNNNGGFLIIGFDNDTHQPDENVPESVRRTFHVDAIQSLVSKYASPPFEVVVCFVNKDGQDYPVLCIEPGFKTPVITKVGLNDASGKALVKENCIYVRTLSSNNTPSTSEIRQQDWPRLFELCFDNREADIVRFVRRHLDNLNAERITELVSVFHSATSSVNDSNESRLAGFVQECNERYQQLITERKLSLPDHGFWEAAFMIVGSTIKYSANEEFLNLIRSSNPEYTGWPLWVDSRMFRDSESHPHVFKGGWEALLVFLSPDSARTLDFWRIHPKGFFYHRRALEDDIPYSGARVVPLTALHLVKPTYLVTEAVALALSFAKATGASTDANLIFRFRWTRLLKRHLTRWPELGEHMLSNRVSHQDEVISTVALPLDTALSSLAPFVYKAVKPLYEVFNGFDIGIGAVDEFVTKLLQRRT